MTQDSIDQEDPLWIDSKDLQEAVDYVTSCVWIVLELLPGSESERVLAQRHLRNLELVCRVTAKKDVS